jgi:repressor LexA
METAKFDIRKFYKNNKRLPTYREMQDLLGYASKGGVLYFVEKLIADGFLSRESGKIVPGPTFATIRLLGTVEAGFPSVADEDVNNTLSLDELLIDHKEATYMLSVKGDSMKDAGILHGDMILVERCETAKPGSIVVAEVDGEYTLKYLRKDGSSFYLEPANKSFKNIYPTSELRIQGIVTGVIRKY